MKRNIILILCILGFSQIFADQIRGSIDHILTLSNESQTVMITPGKLLAITADDLSMLEGLQISIKPASSLLRFRDSFAVFVYKQVSPFPAEEVFVYNGNKLTFDLLPTVQEVFLEIPFVENHSFVRSVDTVQITQQIDEQDFPLLFTIQPIMKGLPDSIIDAEIEITLNPVQGKFGTVNLVIEKEDDVNEPYDLFIDNQIVTSVDKPLILSSGVHTIKVLSNAYRAYSQNIAVSTGEEIQVEIELEVLYPKFIFELPDSANTFVDGELINTSEDLDLQPGEHVLLIEFGDYSLSRTIRSEFGKEYQIKLSFELEIAENSQQ
jgi:hypothetical protein